MKRKRGYYDVFVRTCARTPSRVAVTLYKDGAYKKYTYSELYGVCEYISQNIQQLQYKKGVIGLISKRNIFIPCIIAATHKCCTSFMFLDPEQSVKSLIDEINLTIIITIRESSIGSTSELFGRKADITIEVFDLVVDFYSQGCSQDKQNASDYTFIVQTSGSTGEPKHIQVPVHSIQPNIDDLTKMFNITSDDVIYFSTPLTFDPSMVEILLACMNGASLLIAPDNAQILFPKNIENSITFWQTTPSRFFQYSDADIRNKILSANSTLKILALGGEPLNGISRLKELKDKNNKTRIFSLYGVTEMSCWACVAELDVYTIQSDKEVPLGICLSETQIIVEPIDKDNNTGKVILVSDTRQCVILNSSTENSLKRIDTGDLAEIKHGTIYYRGRKDDVIKRFGNKVNMHQIESVIMSCPQVKACSCLWLPKPMLLVVYYSSDTLTTGSLSNFLRCKMQDKHWPDHIIRVDSLPTNAHGKISKLILSRMFENKARSLSEPKSMFLKELNNTLGKLYSYNEIKDKDFFSIGGTSFLAVTMCNRLALNYPKLSKFVLSHILTEMTIHEIMELAEKTVRERRNSLISGKHPLLQTDSFISKKTASSCPATADNFIVLWSHDTGKCVDASPSLFLTGFNLHVAVGSHSGKIIVADASSGAILGQLDIKSRIEASVLCCQHPPIPPVGVVGAYDGTIVCFVLENCKALWKINVSSMIKSKAVYCNGYVYVAAYDGKIRVIDVMRGTIKNTIKIVKEAISADLAIAKNHFLLIGTLSGVCASVQTQIFTQTKTSVAWRAHLKSPVFAAPVTYDSDKYVVFAEVGGEIHCLTVEKGIKIWRYQGTEGNIFSSVYIKELDSSKWQIVFGCHDRHVYSLILKNCQPSLYWKTEMTSQVYATPCGLGDKLILAVSTDGRICVIDCTNGNITSEHRLPGEGFSSPAVYGDYIFVGCRNDHIYGLKYALDISCHNFRVTK